MNVIEKFYKEKGYKLSFLQIEEICKTPFRMLQILMENDDNIASVRLEHLGLFKLSKRRISYCMFVNKKQFDECKITQEEYLKRKEKLEEIHDLIEY